MPLFNITQADGVMVATIIIKNKPVVLHSSNPVFPKVLELLKTPDTTEQEIEDAIFAKQKQVQSAILGEGDFTIESGIVSYKGLTLPDVLSERLIMMAQEGFDVGPLKAFVENLAQNPSFRVFSQLFGFIDYGKMALTPKGYILAYKKVRPDYKDIHSGQFDNSVGQTHKMTRLLVDDNPDHTCSSGFHVCSYDYLQNFGGSVEAGYHVVVCEVNPKDVVSVPVDYQNTKMRVCEYTVVGEVDDYVRQDENVLAAASVSNGSEFEIFVVETADEDGVWSETDRHTRMSAAFESFSTIREDIENGNSEDTGVRVVNSETGEVLECFEN